LSSRSEEKKKKRKAATQSSKSPATPSGKKSHKKKRKEGKKPGKERSPFFWNKKISVSQRGSSRQRTKKHTKAPKKKKI